MTDEAIVLSDDEPLVVDVPTAEKISPHFWRLSSRQPFSSQSALKTLNRYRSDSTTGFSQPALPTIVSVESLAKVTPGPSPSGCKRKAKVSVFKKQVYRPNVSTSESIDESIEACIRRHSSSDSQKEPDVLLIDDSSNDAELGDFANPCEQSNTIATNMIASACKSPISCDGEVNEKLTCDTKAQEEGKSNDLEESGAEHSVLFHKFQLACANLEDDVMCKQKLSEKLQKYYLRTKENYLKSFQFTSLITDNLNKLTRANLYKCVKDVLDELKINKERKTGILLPAGNLPKNSVTAFETHVSDSKNKKKVEKLQNALNILSKKIKKLEEAEVDLDDEEDSTYLRMQSYRARFSSIYNELCKYTDSPKFAGRATKKKFRFDGTAFPAVNNLITRWLNKTGRFPDFKDVVDVIKNLDLGVTPTHLQTIAAEAFQTIGEHLQKCRRRELWDVLGEYDTEPDPAEKDEDLSKKLEENKKLSRRKEQEIIDKFVEKQINSQAKPENEPDKSEESEDENSETDEGDALAMAAVIISSDDDSKTKERENVENETEELEKSPKRPRLDVPDGSAHGVVDGQMQTQESRKKNNKVSGKPFGTVGNVIELDYLSVENNSVDVFRHIYNKGSISVLKDCSNIKLNRDSVCKRTFLPPRKLNLKENCKGLRLNPASSLYKTCGTVTNGDSSTSNTSPPTNSGDDKEGQCSGVEESAGTQGSSGSNGSDDGDKNNGRRPQKTSNKEDTDAPDDDEEAPDIDQSDDASHTENKNKPHDFPENLESCPNVGGNGDIAFKENKTEKNSDQETDAENGIAGASPLAVSEEIMQDVIGAGSTKSLEANGKPLDEQSVCSPEKIFEKPKLIDNGEESETEAETEITGENASVEKEASHGELKVIEPRIPPKNSETLISDPSSAGQNSSKLNDNEPGPSQVSDDSDEIEVISQNIVKRSPPPEERVKRFLANASKLAITVTRKRPMTKETKDALDQIKKMKNINIIPSRVPKESPPKFLNNQAIRFTPMATTQPGRSGQRNQTNFLPRISCVKSISPVITSVRGRGGIRGVVTPRGLPYSRRGQTRTASTSVSFRGNPCQRTPSPVIRLPRGVPRPQTGRGASPFRGLPFQGRQGPRPRSNPQSVPFVCLD